MAAGLAHLQGCEAAVLAPSTLHLFWDFLSQPPAGRVAVLIDEAAYAIARWGAERAAGRGAPVQAFRHHDSGALARRLRFLERCRRPVVVTDGLCPDCGRVAPLPEYLDMVETRGGLLVVDDSQALGLLGVGASPTRPYGSGGGGSARWLGAVGPALVLVSSLAKSLGVPVAVLAGSAAVVRRFERESETRVHCSPPSAAHLHAAEHAIAVNQEHGDALRRRLADNVALFRDRMRGAGIPLRGGWFPVQTLGIPGHVAPALHARLAGEGLRTVLHRDRHSGEPRISLLLSAAHEPEGIEEALRTLLAVLPRRTRPR